MKTTWYLGLILMLFFRFDALAQDEQVQLELKLTDPASKISHSYKLFSVNYSISKPYYLGDESKAAYEGNCGINMEVAKNPDDFLLKWVAGTIKNASGVITMVVIGDTKKPRSIAFTGAQIGGSAEGFYSTGDTNNAMQITLYVNTLSVDGTTIFTLSKPANQ